MSWSLPIVLLLISRSSACGSCPCVILPGEDLSRPATMVPRARRQSEAIFAGRVVAVDTLSTGQRWFPTDSSPQRRLISWADTVRYTFMVSTIWKGKGQREMTVIVPWASSSCGRTFEVAEEYLVYAERGHVASSCARAQPLRDASADMAVLGQGQKPD